MPLLNSMLERFVQVGSLTVIEPDGSLQSFRGKSAEPCVTVRLTDPKLLRKLLFKPELAAGEAYMDGTLLVEEGSIRDLLYLFMLNRKNLRGQPLQKTLKRWSKRLRKWHQRNSASRSKANVAHHYDLSNDLYRLFLDEDLNYSCAYYETPSDSLEAAQRNKQRHIAAKLDLKPGQKVLDIGCGWGGMSLYMAELFEVDVLGITLSEEQLKLARQRAADRPLKGKVRFELQDYRSLQGDFDRIVSIGMFEHVGLDHHRAYFDQVSKLLKPEGVALLHSIGRAGGPGATAAWLRKYIFPGGYSPALSETLTSLEPSGLWVTDVEILRLHYAETLLAWDERFQEHRAEAAALLDERFCRMWEFYLIACEFGFRYGKQMVFQIQMSKARDALPITRAYMNQAEERLRQLEGLPKSV